VKTPELGPAEYRFKISATGKSSSRVEDEPLDFFPCFTDVAFRSLATPGLREDDEFSFLQLKHCFGTHPGNRASTSSVTLKGFWQVWQVYSGKG
jgi:hypothetical protein